MVKFKKHTLIIFIIIVLIISWAAVAERSSEFSFFLSSPAKVLEYAKENWRNLLCATGITSLETIVGLVIAIIISFILVVLCLYIPALGKVIMPIMIVSQVLPIITLAPFFIILFGNGILSKISLVILMCFFPVFMNFQAGVNSLQKTIKELLFIYDAKNRFRIFKVIFPLSTPYIFTGLRLCTTMSLMGAIVAEFLGSKYGLGKNLYLAPKSTSPELMVCTIIIVTIVGIVLFQLVNFAEKKIGFWYKN